MASCKCTPGAGNWEQRQQRQQYIEEGVEGEESLGPEELDALLDKYSIKQPSTSLDLDREAIFAPQDFLPLDELSDEDDVETYRRTR